MNCPNLVRRLFRPSRPDFIETECHPPEDGQPYPDCSGLLGRTSLRHTARERREEKWDDCSGLLGRTSLRLVYNVINFTIYNDCSGLLGRTSLRRGIACRSRCRGADCSGLLGRTSLRPFEHAERSENRTPRLFRPSRPDFIETAVAGRGSTRVWCSDCSGLLGRTSLRPAAAARCSAAWRHCSGLLGRTSLRQSGPWLLLPYPFQNCSGLLGRTSLRLVMHLT